MNQSLWSRILEILKRKLWDKRWQRAVTCLAAVAVFATTYALILPAITMTNKYPTLKAEEDIAWSGEELSLRVEAGADASGGMKTIVLTAEGRGADLSPSYVFNEEGICVITDEAGKEIELHRSIRKEDELNAKGDKVAKFDYWFTLESGDETAFMLEFIDELDENRFAKTVEAVKMSTEEFVEQKAEPEKETAAETATASDAGKPETVAETVAETEAAAPETEAAEEAAPEASPSDAEKAEEVTEAIVEVVREETVTETAAPAPVASSSDADVMEANALAKEGEEKIVTEADDDDSSFVEILDGKVINDLDEEDVEDDGQTETVAKLLLSSGIGTDYEEAVRDAGKSADKRADARVQFQWKDVITKKAVEPELVAYEDGATIAVFYDDKAGIPAGAELSVREIEEDSDEYKEYLAQASEAVAKASPSNAGAGRSVTHARFFDITILDADGNEIEPETAVKVVITYEDMPELENEGALDVVHFTDETPEVFQPATVNGESKVEGLSFSTGSFSVYGIIGTQIITTPAGTLSFQGSGYTVKIAYTEKSEIPIGTELTVRELEPGSDEYSEYLARTEAALRGDEKEVNPANESTFEKASRLLSGFDKLRQTNIFDIVLVYGGKEIEPNPNYPLSVEITYDADISQKKEENKLDAKIVHFAEKGTEVISNVELQENKDGSVTLSYEQKSFSRTAASLLGSYGNGGWIGGNGNTLVFRYGYATINGEPVFEIQYNGGAINTSTLVAVPGTWPGDSGYPHNPQTGVYFDGTCDPGTTMMELIEACNSCSLATSASCDGFKVIMGTTYTVNATTGAHSIQTLDTMPRDLRTTIGDSFMLGRTSEEYWYSYRKIFRIERGLDANGNGWHDALVYNNGSLPLDILAGVIIDNKSANSDVTESNGSDDSKTGAIYPIAVISDGGLGAGAASASGLTMFFNGCYITDSSYNGTPVGTGVKIINLGSLEMFSHGNTATGAASSYIENMAVAVDQISGKTRLKTAVDPFGSAHHNTIGVALSYGQSIGKWYLHLNANMSRIPIWLRSVTQWKSGDIVMDSGWQIAGTLRSPVENSSSHMDINKLNLVNQSNTSTVMGLEYYVGTNQDPYPVIRFYAGTVYNTRTHQWYKTLYDAVTPGRTDVTGAATQIQDNDTLVFYGNTLETNQIVVNYNVTIRGAYSSEDLNGTETSRAALGNYTAVLSGASTNWISVSAGKTVTFGGNATTDSNGNVGTVTTGTPGTLTIDGGGTISYDIVNWGTTNLKNNIVISNASVAGVFQDGEEHLYEDALFSGNAVDHLLVSDGTVAGNHYITLETTNPNNGNAVTNSLGAANTQYNGRDVVVAGTTQDIQNNLDQSYLAWFTLTDKDDEYDYVYTANGGPNGDRVLELKQKAAIKVRVIKVDADNNNARLNGAGFTLYKDASGTWTPYTLGNETNPHVTDGTGATAGQTEMSMRDGSYKLSETGVPVGYDGASDITFTVNKDATNNGDPYIDTTTYTRFSLVSGTTDTYQITVQNTRKTVPVTLRKVNTAGTALGGVTFGLDSQSTTHTTGDGNNGTTLGEVSLGSLKYGSTHTLHETWSNSWYKPLNGDITFAVDGSTGAVTITSDTGDTVEVTGNTTDGYVIKITNHPKTLPVKLVKIDQAGNTLKGATVSLVNSRVSPPVSVLRPAEVAAIQTNGFVELDIDRMYLDTVYTISESAAPAGYNLLTDEIKFKIEEDQNNQNHYVLKTESGNVWSSSSPLQIDDSTGTTKIVLKLKNDAGVELPQTGGTGTLAYTFGGLMLLIASALMYGFSMRRGERRSI